MRTKAQKFKQRTPSAARRCCSSVVEHSLGKGEVDSSILSSSTILNYWPSRAPGKAPGRWRGMIRISEFGRAPDGHQARLFTLENDRLRVGITDHGGRMVSIEAPDAAGRRGHMLLGFGDIGTYLKAGGGFGALLGRNANRIGGGRFAIDGRTYQAATNDGKNTLHGGPRGFDKQP